MKVLALAHSINVEIEALRLCRALRTAEVLRLPNLALNHSLVADHKALENHATAVLIVSATAGVLLCQPRSSNTDPKRTLAWRLSS